MPPEKNEPKLDEITMLVIRTTAKETVEEHQRTCAAFHEFFGNGTDGNPGVKTRVRDNTTRIKALENCKKGMIRFLTDKLAGPVIAALIVALLLGWMNHREPEKTVKTKPPPAVETVDGSEAG